LSVPAPAEFEGRQRQGRAWSSTTTMSGPPASICTGLPIVELPPAAGASPSATTSAALPVDVLTRATVDEAWSM
jgi:hypothetical protein